MNNDELIRLLDATPLPAHARYRGVGPVQETASSRPYGVVKVGPLEWWVVWKGYRGVASAPTATGALVVAIALGGTRA